MGSQLWAKEAFFPVFFFLMLLPFSEARIFIFSEKGVSEEKPLPLGLNTAALAHNFVAAVLKGQTLLARE